jgi:cyclopropane fatty-acyl-phospholipid synthase-like methyltransferase
LLKTFNIGEENQHILDLGAGTGALSIPFAIQDATVTANDVTQNQIDQLKNICQHHRLDITTIVSPAEEMDFPAESFDCITASMCWGYLNKDVMVPKIKSWLKKDGVFMKSTLNWKSGGNEIADITEKLLQRYNPDWRKDRKSENNGIVDSDMTNDFELKTYHSFTHSLPFTLESWRGRIRACRGMGAFFPEETVATFDAELQNELQDIAKGKFMMPHNISFKIYGVKNS